MSLTELAKLKGAEIGVSDWFPIDQPLIDAFANTTQDHQFIHVDPVAARATPLGGTIAHGFLTLSLLSAMANSVIPGIDGARSSLNYGFNRLRFVAPVRSGKRVRGRFVLGDVALRAPGNHQLAISVTVEIEGESRPALVADWLTVVETSGSPTEPSTTRSSHD